MSFGDERLEENVGTTVFRDELSARTGRVSYLRAGDPSARRVIFVHGSPGDASNWGAYLVEPIAGADVIAIDRPGFGESEPRGVVTSLREQAAAIEPLLDDTQPILVGHSLGAPVALRAAIDFPGRVGGLVLISASVDPALEDLRWYNHVGSVIEWLLPRPLKNSNREMKSLPAELEELAPLITQVRCPVVIVHGELDDLVPVANVDFLVASLVNARSVEVIRLPGEGHFVLWTDAGEQAVRRAIAMLVGTSNEPEEAEQLIQTPSG